MYFIWECEIIENFHLRTEQRLFPSNKEQNRSLNVGQLASALLLPSVEKVKERKYSWQWQRNVEMCSSLKFIIRIFNCIFVFAFFHFHFPFSIQ